MALPLQPVRQLERVLRQLSTERPLLLTTSDIHGVVPKISDGALRVMLTRAASSGVIERVCRGLYWYGRPEQDDGLLLYHAAARLRADAFNYVSLESGLSDAGVISQVLPNWVTVMSTGRSATISCGARGHIEFVHTHKRPTDVIDELTYDSRCGMWRASVPLALRDMKAARRTLELVDWSLVNEPV